MFNSSHADSTTTNTQIIIHKRLSLCQKNHSQIFTIKAAKQVVLLNLHKVRTIVCMLSPAMVNVNTHSFVSWDNLWTSSPSIPGWDNMCGMCRCMDSVNIKRHGIADHRWRVWMTAVSSLPTVKCQRRCRHHYDQAAAEHWLLSYASLYLLQRY